MAVVVIILLLPLPFSFIKSIMDVEGNYIIIIQFLMLCSSFSLVYYFHIRFSHYPFEKNLVIDYPLIYWLLLAFIIPNGIFISMNLLSRQIQINYQDGLTIKSVIGNLSVAMYEELIFRGLLFLGILIRSGKPIISAIISSIAFSSIHFHTYSWSTQWYVFIGIAFIGMLLCYLYVLSNSIWPPICFHWTINILSDLVVYNNTNVSVIGDKIQAAALTTISLAFFFIYRKKIMKT